MLKAILLSFFLCLPSFAGPYNMFKAPVTGTATTTSTQVLAQNNLRQYLIILNTGAAPIYVKFGSVQSGTEGVPIPANGNYEPLKAPSNSIYIDTASGSSTYTIIEGQ